MTDIILEAYSVNQSGNIGQVIRGPDGKIVAGTTDGWVAQVICKLLIENNHLLVINMENYSGK